MDNYPLILDVFPKTKKPREISELLTDF